jgi:hypothetical protein
MPGDIAELIARLETATGPRFDLDDAIWRVVRPDAGQGAWDVRESFGWGRAMSGLRVLICGGRDLTDANWINKLSEYDAQYGPFTHIIQGGANGADAMAKRWAELHLIPSTEYRANWRKHGNAAEPIRNQRMLDEAKPDLVIALPGGRGTADMMARANAAGVTVIDIARYPWPDLP